MSELTVKNQLTATRTINEEKAQPWGFILFVLNLVLFFLGLMLMASGIGVADHGTAAQNALYNTPLLVAPFLLPLPTLALLGLRRFIKKQLPYSLCSGLIWASTISALLSTAAFIYLMQQVF